MTEPIYPERPPEGPVGPPALPWAPPPEAASPVRRAPSRLLAAAAGLLIAGAGAAFAVRSFGDDRTGAATPEDAALRLVDAVAEEDILGVVDLLPDDERELLRDLTTGIRDEYQRLGVLSESFTLDGFRGVDITVEDVEVDVEEIVDGLAQVTITGGELTIEVDGDELVGNLGEVVEAVAEARDAEIDVDDSTERAGADEVGASFVVIEEDGRWHPSLALTIAEAARAGTDAGPPDLDGGVEPEGAGSPEGAVQALIDAGVAFDAEAAVAVLDPGEMRAVQVYADLFLPAEAEAPEDVEIEAELTDAEVDDLGGGASRVVPTGFELRFSADGGTGEIVLDDGCVRADIQPPAGEGEPFDEEFCLDGEQPLPGDLADVEVPEELQEVAEAFLPLRFGIVTVERDGEHFVAPARTLVDAVLGLTSGLEPDDVQEGGPVFALLSGELDEEVEDLLDQLFESAAFGGGFEFDEIDEPIGECEGIGCGFEDPGFDDGAEPTRQPTGPSGPDGALLPFDVVEGSVRAGGSAVFTAVADADGDYLIGAQGLDGFDATITVLDAAGDVIAENDDFNGVDPEVLVTLAAGDTVTIEVAGFAGFAGDFVVYVEPF